MRISDWSSDVCSSDLTIIAGAVQLRSDRHQAEAQSPYQACAAARALFRPFGGDPGRDAGACPCAARQWDARDAAFGRLCPLCARRAGKSEEHTSELQSLMRMSYAVFCLQKIQYIT